MSDEMWSLLSRKTWQSFSFCILAGILMVSCRSDHPPQIGVICILDGTGGGDCVLSDGTKVHKLPSDMLNYWATTQVDEANFSSWCYKTTPAVANTELDRIKGPLIISRAEHEDEARGDHDR